MTVATKAAAKPATKTQPKPKAPVKKAAPVKKVVAKATPAPKVERDQARDKAVASQFVDALNALGMPRTEFAKLLVARTSLAAGAAWRATNKGSLDDDERDQAKRALLEYVRDYEVRTTDAVKVARGLIESIK